MPETLTESFCERCGTRYEFKAPTRLGPLRKTRGLVSGLRNYIMSQDALGDAIGDAMRSEEDGLAARQLEVFHQSFNFCIDCRQYTCVKCWNDEAGRCRSCAPVAGTDDLIEQMEAAFAASPGANGQPLGAAVLDPSLGAETWPSHDLVAEGSNGHAELEWPAAELYGTADASQPEPLVAEEPEPEPVVADEPEREAEPEPEPFAADEALPETFEREPGIAEELEPEPFAATEAPDRPWAEPIAAGDDTWPEIDAEQPLEGWERRRAADPWATEPAAVAEEEAPEPNEAPALAAAETEADAAPALAAAQEEPEQVVAEADALTTPTLAWDADGDYQLIEEPEGEPVIAEAEFAFEPEPVASQPQLEFETEAEPFGGEAEALAAEPEPEAVTAAAEPEPTPIAAQAEPEPPEAAAEPEPEPTPIRRDLSSIGDTILRLPRRPQPVERPDEQVAAQAEESTAARRAQLDLLGLEDPGEGAVAAQRQVLPYRSRAASIHPAELAAAAAASGSFWEASAREVAGAAGNVGIQNCGQCGLSLSASARFCRRCGTRQARSA